MTDGQTMLFLHGADMTPGAIRRAWPGARFVARARMAAPPGGADTWGILIAVPDAAGTGAPVTATTDDGRSITAHPALQEARTADPAADVAAARYWELPPAYVARLAELVPTP